MFQNVEKQMREMKVRRGEDRRGEERKREGEDKRGEERRAGQAGRQREMEEETKGKEGLAGVRLIPVRLI